MKDFYETQSVGAGRKSYSCEYCGKSIAAGSPSDVHKFYPEFYALKHIFHSEGRRTHKKCSKDFLASEECTECGELCTPEELSTFKKADCDPEEYFCCKTCFNENRGAFTGETIGVV